MEDGKTPDAVQLYINVMFHPIYSSDFDTFIARLFLKKLLIDFMGEHIILCHDWIFRKICFLVKG